MVIDSHTYRAFKDIVGKRCCRQRVGRGRSLSIGFGQRIPHFKQELIDSFYGEWEIGTYSSAWRIIRGDQVLCGSMDMVDSVEELDEQLQSVELGTLLDIEMLSIFDIRVKLSGGVYIDFFLASTDDDEMFHIFGPGDLYVEYQCPEGWTVNKSNIPWSPGAKAQGE